MLDKNDPTLIDFIAVSQQLHQWWKSTSPKDQANLKAHCLARKKALPP